MRRKKGITFNEYMVFSCTDTTKMEISLSLSRIEFVIFIGVFLCTNSPHTVNGNIPFGYTHHFHSSSSQLVGFSERVHHRLRCLCCLRSPDDTPLRLDTYLYDALQRSKKKHTTEGMMQTRNIVPNQLRLTQIKENVNRWKVRMKRQRQ